MTGSAPLVNRHSLPARSLPSLCPCC